MKKFLLSFAAFFCTLFAMAEEVVFDFTKPAELTPAVEASDKASSGVSVDATTFTAAAITRAPTPVRHFCLRPARLQWH